MKVLLYEKSQVLRKGTLAFGVVWLVSFQTHNCFYLGFMASQDYFNHSEPIESLCRAKTGDSREKSPDHSEAELGLSHVTRAI